MRIFKIINIILLILSTFVVCYCCILSRDIAPEGFFILESRDGIKLEVLPERLEKAENLYTEMKFDTSVLEKGVLMITVLPYETVKSYRRVEEAANVLNLSEYTIYEAGLVSKSIEEKAMLALWCLLVYVLVCAGFRLFGFLRQSLDRECSMLGHMYVSEFLKIRWKKILSMALLSLGYIGLAAMPLTILTIFPLLPMTSDNTGIRLWNGLTGIGLMPGISTLQFNTALERLWKINSVANQGLIVFFAALILMFSISYRPYRFIEGLRV